MRPMGNHGPALVAEAQFPNAAKPPHKPHFPFPIPRPARSLPSGKNKTHECVRLLAWEPPPGGELIYPVEIENHAPVNFVLNMKKTAPIIHNPAQR